VSTSYLPLQYIDHVGKIHRSTNDKKSGINVEYVHINALFGYVSTVIVNAVMRAGLDKEVEIATVLAFNKLLWVQNDFFAKYYVHEDGDAAPVDQVAELAI
jgi:hypothetical protein